MIPAVTMTYLGVLLCYVASPKSRGLERITWLTDTIPTHGLRTAGIAGAGLGLGCFLAGSPPVQGLLIWLSLLMLAASTIVIFAPLTDRFLQASGALALLVLTIMTVNL